MCTAHHARLAFCDETQLHVPEATYITASAVIDRSRLADIHDALLDLLVRKQNRLHWHAESTERRRKIVATLAGLDVEYPVAMSTLMDLRRQERARRECLRTLLPWLERYAVDQVVLESRGPSADRRDVAVVDAFRGQRILGSRIRVTHRLPIEAPPLWIADAIAGAVRMACAGQDEYIRQLGDRLILLPAP